ncbi:MAG: ABC transporter permease [Oceanospirillaceae bacterium]|nr:ABC transporter permease [Oceanospirillaceae bacterium]MBT4444136.1 ABC transporter permease [Oceanospirillaceae bacterium]MBT6078226.1 ABC transporter permease [Oceanospirillaceae bacterium]
MFMTTANPSIDQANTLPLKEKLAKTTAIQRRRAFLLTLPLVLFLLISFVFPIGQMLFNSIHNNKVSAVVPDFATAIQQWDGQGLPSEATFEIFVKDLAKAKKVREVGRTVGNMATRINYEMPGSRSLFTKSARKAGKIKQGPYKEALIKIDKKWANPQVWLTLQRASHDISPSFYVAAMDLKYNETGEVVEADELYQIYLDNFIKTLWLAALITFICVLLAYPVAYLLSVLPLRQSNLLMIMVLLPFWTSLLVRTTAWIAILQTEGVINDLLVYFGVIGDDGRIQMIYNQTGTIIAMVHILLPFMILPLYSVMKTIQPTYMRAALSMGSKPFYAYRRVYLPQTIPGLAAGTLLVFILAIGYYITPALVGGQDGLLISNLIAYHIQKSLNWSLGAALGTMLLVVVLLLYWVYNKLIGIDKLKFG